MTRSASTASASSRCERGRTEGSKPLARGDGRGNAMTYAYCNAAEYAVDEIGYTSFEGAPSLKPSRAVRFVYGIGMALQRSLRLAEIQMLGPGDARS
ncbi:hypothetical protein BE20_04360 [Sorangium cellulosum]|nr:hypothetical protein BE20_04360 [Sorangium cellulosum]